MTLGPTGADPLLKQFRSKGAGGKYLFATFDLSQDIVSGLKDGTIKVAVDQQPSLQGYDAVQVLVLHDRYGVLQANDIA
ncbi:MAG: hypothetical protein JOZ58_21905 [Acetobacteraceae bacterium]|nr:hypothetical protein [Acetobacteraceae bacterium]